MGLERIVDQDEKKKKKKKKKTNFWSLSESLTRFTNSAKSVKEAEAMVPNIHTCWIGTQSTFFILEN